MFDTIPPLGLLFHLINYYYIAHHLLQMHHSAINGKYIDFVDIFIKFEVSCDLSKSQRSHIFNYIFGFIVYKLLCGWQSLYSFLFCVSLNFVFNFL